MAQLSIQPTTDTQSPSFHYYFPLQTTQPYLEPIGRGKDWEARWQELKNEVRRRESNQSWFQQVTAESPIHKSDTAGKEEINRPMSGMDSQKIVSGMKEEWDTEGQSGPYSSVVTNGTSRDFWEGGIWQRGGSHEEKTWKS
jgi:hypothetical protein